MTGLPPIAEEEQKAEEVDRVEKHAHGPKDGEKVNEVAAKEAKKDNQSQGQGGGGGKKKKKGKR